MTIDSEEFYNVSQKYRHAKSLEYCESGVKDAANVAYKELIAFIDEYKNKELAAQELTINTLMQALILAKDKLAYYLSNDGEDMPDAILDALCIPIVGSHLDEYVEKRFREATNEEAIEILFGDSKLYIRKEKE